MLPSNENTDLSISGMLGNFVGNTGDMFPGIAEWDAQAQYMKDDIKCYNMKCYVKTEKFLWMEIPSFDNKNVVLFLHSGW